MQLSCLRNRNYIVVDNDANDVNALTTLFQNDWDESTDVSALG